jgi:hypothetical protein
MMKNKAAHLKFKHFRADSSHFKRWIDLAAQSRISFSLWAVIILLNIVRLVGFNISPPGFYIDEAVGAAHALCIKQTGADYWGLSWPLFSAGPGGGFFTAPYLYGQVLWTSIFGDSVAAFRSFSAFISCLTILFLSLYVGRKVNSRTALYVALMATVSPWVFQFSRIAWDPPLAPFLLVLGLFLLETRSRFSWIYSSIAFSLAAYAYPPTRLQVPLLLLLLPGITLNKTAKMIGVFFVLTLPVWLRSFDPVFTARTRMLALTSDYSGNPYRNENFFGLAWGAIKQSFAHFNFHYLMINGDRNLRHSTREFGIFSWVQFVASVFAIFAIAFDLVRKITHKPLIFFQSLAKAEATLWVVGIVGTVLGIAPAALTWEGVPHSIRSIGAWPFLCILAGLSIECALRWIQCRFRVSSARLTEAAIWVTSLIFFTVYLDVYFVKYPPISTAWFQIDQEPISQAYSRMNQQGLSCESIRPNQR